MADQALYSYIIIHKMPELARKIDFWSGENCNILS